MTAPQILSWRRGDPPEHLVRREWLVTNGLGGYASGTLAGVATRRYHGLLIAALPAPLGRFVMLNHLEERVVVDDASFHLSGDEPMQGDLLLPEQTLMHEFRLEWGLPVWHFENEAISLTKRLLMSHLQNVTWLTYRLDSNSAPVRLTLTPSVHFRPHETDVNTPLPEGYAAWFDGAALEIGAGSELPTLILELEAANVAFEPEARIVPELLYRIEKSRGYHHSGALWRPGTIVVDLKPGETLAVRCALNRGSTETAAEAAAAEHQRRSALLDTARVDAAQQPLLANLVFAADQFIVTPETRRSETAVDDRPSEEQRTIIAGYHWFTDWGRDTMISLDGLTLATGRTDDARSILRMFAHHVRDGLIPNMFPEGEHEGLYHTADATMWFFHAIDRYVQTTGDRALLRELLPVLRDIIQHHLGGTHFGIGVDPADGLLRQGAPGYQLTWMDAKVDGWVVTPRRGKAVDINALFYNAVMLLAQWSEEEGEASPAAALHTIAARTRHSFNERFWYADGGYLFDVVDGEDGGDDAALRPNQIFSIALRHPVLDQERWADVVRVVERELLTPVGLRSLARNHPDYKPTYSGDLRTRDAAYHQGTVWSWLIGPFIDAYLKTFPERREQARSMLRGLEAHLARAGVGSVSEVFDAEEPFESRGCIAQAWGVAELLRCLRLLEP